MTHIKKNKNCSPENIYDGTCLNFKSLQRVASKLNNNQKFGSKKIQISKYNSNTKKKLIEEIRRKLSCHSEIDLCVLKNNKLFNKTIIESFKPIRPKGKHEWLSTIDINDVMKQYEKKYKNFMFMGAVPIDFYELYYEFANMNIKALSKLKKKIGFVFNTDPSYKDGEHWIAMILDLNDKTLCFFDSANSEPPIQVKKFMKDLVEKGKKAGIELNVIINTIEHQMGDSECGVYSLYFLISRLEGKTCKEVFNHKIHDKEMNTFRDIFFRKPT